MNLEIVTKKIYPHAKNGKDFQIEQDELGKQSFSYWDEKIGSIPSASLIQSVWDDYESKKPPEPMTNEEKIRILEDENLNLMLAIAENAEFQEKERTEMQMAVAELAEMIIGGV